VKPQAVAIPLEQFDAVTSLVKEDENTTSEDVFAELVADDGDQSVVGFAEVDGFPTEEDLRGRCEA
jgi:hypothetical protein